MQFPLILINFKNYPSAVGEQALQLLKIHEDVQQDTQKNFAVAVSTLDIRTTLEASKGNVSIFAQHVDAQGYGSSTGKIIAAELKKLGVTGTLLNHSECRIANREELGACIDAAKTAGLVVICCAENAQEGAEIMQEFTPDLIAVEPPELIGGDVSVSTARPELITKSVELIGAGKVLVGAGVKNGKDVQIALELGAVGVLLASGVTKAENSEEVLRDLVKFV